MTDHGSARWADKLVRGCWPVVLACTKNPRHASMARRAFLISLT